MSSAGDSDSDPVRHPLPPIRTFLGTELALPLPPSSSSSWDSPWDSPGAEALRAPRDDDRTRAPGEAVSRTASAASARASPHRAAPSTAHGPAPHTASHPARPVSACACAAHRAPARPRAATLAAPPHPHPYSPAPPRPAARSLPPSPALAPPSARTPPSRAHTLASLLSPAPYAFNVLRAAHPGGALLTAPTRTHPAPPPPPPTPPPPTAPATPRRHVCPICLKRFSRPSSLRTHDAVHTGERRFVCPVPGCGRAFTVASNMRRHVRGHAGHAAAGGEEGEGSGERSAGGLQWAPAYEGPPS